MIKTIKKFCGATRKYLFRDTRYFFLYIYRYFQDNYKNNCNFYSDEEFVQQIKSGRSLLRIGDGEIILLHFLPLAYEIYSDAIRNEFLKIIKEYSDNSKYILMIPLFVNYTNTAIKKRNQFRCWMPLKVTYELIFNKKAKYFDQHIFYKDGGFERLILPYIKTKQVIIVTIKEHVEAIEKSPLASDKYLYVISKKGNAYEARNEIQNDIINLIDKKGLKKENVVILMSAGLAKTIIHDMSNMGYQLFDIGKGLESYYQGISIQKAI